MHFAVGMCGGAALSLAPCLILRRGWRIIPIGMTLGGFWAIIPDMPRIWREDFPSLPFAATLGSMDFEAWLHSIGDVFFFHRTLDSQPKEFALLGLAMIIGLYNLSLLGMWFTRRRQGNQALPPIHHRPEQHSSAAAPSPAPADERRKPPGIEHDPDDPSPTVIGRITHDRTG